MPERTYEERLEDIKKCPENHLHGDFGALVACCLINGAIDLSLMEAHSKHGLLGSNGGTACDVLSGPCACGAWHLAKS